MMTYWLVAVLVLGAAMFGCCIGFVAFALCRAARDGDERAQQAQPATGHHGWRN
jgi:hypothetical protein